MGAKRIGDLFDFSDVFASMYGSEATGGAGEIVTCHVRNAGEADGDGQTGTDVEMWGPACVVFRPKAPDAKGKCQLLTTPIGPALIAIGSRDSRTADATGAMNAGDAAFCSPTGKVALRCNDDGSIAMIKQGETSDSYHVCEADGSWKTGNEWGQYSLGPDGFKVILAGGQAFSLTEKGFTLIAPDANFCVGTIELGLGAAVPLCANPLTPITGSIVPGFCSVKPTVNIFV
jgi:hypothetical protein